MKRGIFYAGMAGAAWGSIFLVPRLLPEFSPLALSCARYVLYGVVSLVVLLPKAHRVLPQLTRRDVVVLVKLALTGNLVFYTLLSAAIQLAGVTTASLIVGVLPVTITLAGRRDAGAVPLARLVWPLALVLTGVGCINLETFLTAGLGAASLGDRALGVLCAAVALLCWTQFATDNARYLKQSRFNSSDWSSLWGVTTGLLSALVWGLAEAFSFAGTTHLPAERWQLFWVLNAGAALLGSWFGNWMWNSATRRLPLTLGGQLIVFETLFALLYGFLYLQRLPTALELIAATLLIGGVCWTVRRHGAVHS
ncbi:DMT family transporter [Crenobacter sp. SG2303]|uniref:DMT family transporter n=1 Tax=Crenobacter oryzisoli TaxID=3056844 RepID=A0ABT7XUL1_9NEIS|nr:MULTISPECIES: DMT family transporter [unclassified Crenobacter]MDN0077423.1 DMT family transporter [Crenobacter sp. SG2303]MDN0085692.1 DMT family transporter [Crenobacter sp. SG2305]